MKKKKDENLWEIGWTKKDEETLDKWLVMFKDIPKEDITKHYTEVRIMTGRLIRTTFSSFMGKMGEFVAKGYDDYGLTNAAIKHSFDHFMLVNKTAIEVAKKACPDFDEEILIQNLRNSFQECLDILIREVLTKNR